MNLKHCKVNIDPRISWEWSSKLVYKLKPYKQFAIGLLETSFELKSVRWTHTLNQHKYFKSNITCFLFKDECSQTGTHGVSQKLFLQILYFRRNNKMILNRLGSIQPLVFCSLFPSTLRLIKSRGFRWCMKQVCVNPNDLKNWFWRSDFLFRIRQNRKSVIPVDSQSHRDLQPIISIQTFGCSFDSPKFLIDQFPPIFCFSLPLNCWLPRNWFFWFYHLRLEVRARVSACSCRKHEHAESGKTARGHVLWRALSTVDWARLEHDWSTFFQAITPVWVIFGFLLVILAWSY